LKGKLLLLIILLSAFTPPVYGQAPAGIYTNPLVKTRDSADPWMVFHRGYYYFTATLDPEGGIWVWKSRTLAGLDSGVKVKVHTPDAKERAGQIWAPELHFINNRWYMYYTASDGVDENHRLYVLESRGRDPLGPYSFKARIYDPSQDGWAIDPSVFRAPDGRLYLLWVAHVPGNGNGIRIAPLSNPWTVAGSSDLIAQADYDWERVRYPINEGPVVLRRAGRLFLVYSASDTGTPDYALGMLTHVGGDVMEPRSWKKSPTPVFSRYTGAEGAVYGPGHNGFFKSPDGREDWMIYHGKEASEYTYRGRSARAQRFRWRTDGTPDFGRPIPRDIPLRVPSGERGPRGRRHPKLLHIITPEMGLYVMRS
jgi:GH43 family beta-xylosidase